MRTRNLLLLSLLLSFNFLNAQTCADYAVQLSATVQTSPPKIVLSWRPLADSPTYSIYRKSLNSTSWGMALANLPYNDSTFTDNTVATDTAFEYYVNAQGTTTSTTAIDATGFIYAGIQVPAIHNRGTLILLVDSTFTDSCQAGIYRLMQDISGDGWEIIRHDFARTLSDVSVHAAIKNDYLTHPNVKSVLLLGHIAVPYSGDLNPDGHPNHLGAWPADVYYANMNGVWTDASVNDTSASYTANHNVPGDGKWDPTQLPDPDELEVSRIDFYNMPAFAHTEVQLMNSYLSKDHIYKMDSLAVNHRGLVSDNFGVFGGEAFAANAWRNFPPLIGKANIQSINFITSLNDSSYQWAYGCGGGSFTSSSGIGATTDFSNNNVNAIFTMLFGSYFGDWNVQNDFMRAPLCSNIPALTSCWAGRPNWFFHHMALGENIGYSAMLTQNNTYLYGPLNYGANWVHVALMGDLTLRTDYINPARNLSITSSLHGGANLTWTISADPAVIGYYVYRSDTLFGNYTLISTLLTTTSFTDISGTDGLKYYMVRPAKLQSTPSGTYYNLGIGITDTATISFPTSVANLLASQHLSLFPNPARENLNMMISCDVATDATMFLIDQNGQKIHKNISILKPGNNSFSFDISKLATGMYMVVVITDKGTFSSKWIKME